MLVTIALVVGGILAIVVAAVLILAASKPDTFVVQRRATVKADPGQIFTCINDFHNWAAWSPFEKIDPNMQKTFSGAASGKGAVYEWKGNNKAGTGRMEILESSAPNKVVIRLDFLKPFEGHNTSEFTMLPKGDLTEVTWAMHGPSAFMMKVMNVFISMDKMMGKDFEEGLANMKAVAEK